MSLLFPLYALGALALAAPIIFHLFQRKPHGQQEFSSLMFLQATPPKLTRRSKLSDLLLLLLRGLALLLLAAAFARPFLRSTTLLDLDAPIRSIALLVDTSASLRRDGLWDEQKKAIDTVVKDLRPTDQVMLMSYDRKPTTLISFEAWEETEAGRRIAFLREQVGGLQPTWFETDLSAAAIEASDALLQTRLVDDQNQPLQVVVFTDLQKGTDLSGLQSYQWPEEISVDMRAVAAKKKTNASLQALPPEAGEMDAAQVRVLVRNEGDSDRAQFAVQWEGPNSKPVDVYVPPGQTRVVRVTQPRGAVQLELSGDDHVFDNQLFLTETRRQQQELWYIGDDDATDKRGQFYYLRQAALGTRTRQVTIKQLEDVTRLATAVPELVPMVVVSKVLSGDPLEDLKRYASRGGRVLVVLDQDVAAKDTTALAGFLSSLLSTPELEVLEPEGQDYMMLAKIDFQHPLFAPFADPRFNDFTKIRFWSHRVIGSASDGVAREGEEENNFRVIAQFEDESPALIEKQLDTGTVWVMTSGWQPKESQLALSTKFIPLLHGFFGQSTPSSDRTPNYVVGQAIPITATDTKTTLLGPSGETFQVDANVGLFEEANEPGLYEVQQGTQQYKFAVNLAASETQTEALLPDRLEQLGLRLGKQRSVESLKADQRQMRNKELEGKQKLWRWGIVVALVFVALETLLSSQSAVRLSPA